MIWMTCERYTTSPGKLALLFSNNSVGPFMPPFDFTNERRTKKTRPMAWCHSPVMRSSELRHLKFQTAWSHQFFLRPWLMVWPRFKPTTSCLADQYSLYWANQAAFMYMQPTVFTNSHFHDISNLCLNEVHDRIFYLSPLSRILSFSIKSSLLFFPLLGVTLRCKKRDCHELGTSKLTLKLDMSHFVTVKPWKKCWNILGLYDSQSNWRSHSL